MNTVERLPIQTNDIIGGPGRGIYNKPSQYVPLESCWNLQNFKAISGIYSELPTKRHKGGGFSTIKVAITIEGETPEYKTLADLPLIEKEIL